MQKAVRTLLCWGFFTIGMASVALAKAPQQTHSAVPVAQRGVLDLRQWDFQKQGPLTMRGAWWVYWKQLLTPQQAVGRKPDGTLPVPGLWNGASLAGQKLRPDSYATYRLTILLRQPQVLSLRLNRIYSAYKLFVNGKLRWTQGVVATHPARAVMHVGPKILTLHAPGRVELLLQISNFSYRKGGPSDALKIGTSAQLLRARSLGIAYDALIFGILFIIGLYYLALHLIIRRSLSTLYFAILCLLASFRVLLVHESVMQSLWQQIPYTSWLRLEYILNYTFNMVGLSFLQVTFPQTYSPRITRFFQVYWGILTLATLFTTSWIYTHMLWGYFISIPLGSAYVLYGVFKALWQREDGASYLLVGVSCVIAGAVYDGWAYSSAGELSVELSQLGLLVLIFSQALLLAARFSNAFRRVEELSHDLQHKNTQLQQMNRLKDEFLANTSHELRTPLNGIIGLSESLRDGATGELPQKTKNNLDLIVQSGRRLSHLIDDILAFSKLRHQEVKLSTKPLELEAPVETVMTLSYPLVGDKPLSLHYQIPPDLPPVQADEDRLQQILYNLVGNAIKFTPAGEVEVTAKVQNNRIAVSVSDTGIGIPPDRQEHIFQPFTQADGSTERVFGGTGLGLAITKKLVELHGGELTVHSVPGEGSTFTFTLHIADSASSPEHSTPTSATQREKPTLSPYHDVASRLEHLTTPLELDAANGQPAYRILIVDDEPVNLQVLHNYLSLEQFEVSKAKNGIEMLEYLQQEEKPDLVLLDVMMPMLSGYDACRQIRKMYSLYELPVLMLTAKDQPTDVVEGFLSGANDYITKPFTREVLLSRIRTHLQLSQLTQELEAQVRQRTEELQEALQQIQRQHQQLKETQVQLIQSEKMASLGTLVSGIAHEINNPVNFTVQGSRNLQHQVESLKALLTELAEEDTEVVSLFETKFQPIFRSLEAVFTGSERVQQILTGLRLFSRLDEAEEKPVPLVENLEATLALVKANYENQVTFAYDFQANPTLLCFPSQLNQVFMHLAINACQALQQRAQNASEAYTPRLEVRTRMEGDDVCIEFIDNGIGISEDIQSRIFEPFFTTRTAEGTGLGLSISYGIIEKHKGRITVTSEEGKGSTFRVFLRSQHLH